MITRLKQMARQLGFEDCRVTTAAPPESGDRFQSWLKSGHHATMAYLERNATKRVDPQTVLPGARSIVTLAASYACSNSQTNFPHTESRGVIARYARFSDYHDVLGKRLETLTLWLNDQAGPGARSLWHVDTGPVLERDLAQRAGLGFIGKHTNLIHRRLGNWFFIGEILTTAVLPADDPEKNRCGNCTRCLEACPTHAFEGPFQLNARKCISYLTIELKGSIPDEWRPAIGNRIFGCDDCLEICPWNRFAREGRIMKNHRRAELSEGKLLRFLSLDEDGFKSMFRGTPILRSKRRGFLRNVCVALGNHGGKESLPDLEKAAQDPEPLIAEHAQWAMERIRFRVA